MSTHRGSTSRRMPLVTTWLAIYPAITTALWLFKPLGLLTLPLPVAGSKRRPSRR